MGGNAATTTTTTDATAADAGTTATGGGPNTTGTDAGKKTTTGALTEEQLKADPSWIASLSVDDTQKNFVKKLFEQHTAQDTELSDAKAKLNEAKAKLAEREQKDAEEQRKRDVEQGNWQKIAEENESKLKAKDERIMRAEVRAQAVKEGLVDPSIIDILPLEGVSIGDDGNVIGVDAFVAKYKKEKSYMFGEQKKAPEGTTTPTKTTATQTTTKATDKDAMDMSPAEFAEHLKSLDRK